MLGAARLRAWHADISLMPASTAMLKSPSRELPDTQAKLRRAAGGRTVRNRHTKLASGSQTAQSTEPLAAILAHLQKSLFFRLSFFNAWELGDDPHTNRELCASCAQWQRWNAACVQAILRFISREDCRPRRVRSPLGRARAREGATTPVPLGAVGSRRAPVASGHYDAGHLPVVVGMLVKHWLLLDRAS